MTLHEAIEKLLIQTGRPMTTREIADALNKNKWYVKKDKSIIDPFQIHGRTRNYSKIFKQDGSTISLLEYLPNKALTITKPVKPREVKKPSERKPDIEIKDIASVERKLMDEKQFKNAGEVDNIIPINRCGLYCIRIPDINKLP